MNLKCIIFLLSIILNTKFGKAQQTSQQVTLLQYFFDVDPGVGVIGNGGLIPCGNISNLNQIISFNSSSISPGLHNLYCRVRDEYGRWSLTQRQLILVEAIDYIASDSIKEVQYFFDNDSGVAVTTNGGVLSLTPEMSVNQSLSIALPNLSSGIHNLYVRVKNKQNDWSLALQKQFIIEYINDTLASALTQYQYFFDVDPGFNSAGNGAIISIDTTNAINQCIFFEFPSLLFGAHHLYFRTKNQQGVWSNLESSTFLQEIIHNESNNEVVV